MSGEDSKSSGELGEKYIKDFLDLIGWSTPQYNESIPCIEPKKHQRPSAKTGRTKHGIDAYFPYESPMDSDTLIHIIGSVKHTQAKYPASPNHTFKNHVSDLAQAIECFGESDLLENNRGGFDFEREEIAGVLFWLSGHKEDQYTSVISRITNPVIDDQLNFQRIHVIDNDRMQFITKAINFIDSKYNEHTRFFHYFDTPNNLSDGKKTYGGDILPIEMLSSDLLIFKLVKNDEITLAIVSKDEFHEDNFKRILGLSHRLSNNLTSNVSIFFPGYENSLQENQNTVNRIKQQFREATFIKGLLVAGYDAGYRGKFDIPKPLLNTPQEKLSEPSSDNGKILPFGEHLRSLLSRSLITDTELKKFLRNKGVYVCNQSKETMIPILSSMLLSPIDFDHLKDQQKTREDREKRYTSKFKIEKEIDIVSVKKTLKTFDLKSIDSQKFPNYDFKQPITSFKLENESKLVLEYEIDRYQGNKSWDQQRDSFTGSVVLDLSGSSLEITTKNIATSKETLVINQKIIKEIENRLKKDGIISSSAKEQKILMNDMSNEEVLRFLLSFTDSTSMTDLDFLEIRSIDIEIDDTISLPADETIKWMEGKIEKLKLDGTQIEQIEILADSKHHKYLKCWGLIAKYNFSGSLGVGYCEIEFRFNSKFRNEFSIQVPHRSYDRKNFGFKEVNELVMSNIDTVKNKTHQDILDSRL